MDETQQDDALNPPPLDVKEELAAIEEDQRKIRDVIIELQQEAEEYIPYPHERVRSGVGRWLIPQVNSFEEHYALVTDRARDIDFSPANYPGFDSVFTELYKGPGFFDPLHDSFPKYANLRDNLATVRNFILQEYFPDNSPQDAVRIQHLKEIASFVAEGLNNDQLFLGLVPVQNPFKPFIDVSEASAPNGEGARYIYSKILEMQRHSTWSRPFAAVTSLFSGGAFGKWGLPPLPPSEIAMAEDAPDDLSDKLEELADLHDDLDRRRATLKERAKLGEIANDLNAFADQLLFTYYQIKERAEDLSEPIRREAIDIAHDILNKLRLKFGDKPLANGLNFNNDDEDAAVGAASSVARVLQRMIGMVRSIGDDPMAIPGVAEAHQAIGQLAYLAKLDALRMATAAGNTRLAGNLKGQLSQLRQFGRGIEGKSFGSLLTSVDRGLAQLRQRMRVLGMHADEHQHDVHSVDGAIVGTGEGSRSQAMTDMRADKLRKQYTKEQDRQKGENQFQQNQASSMGQAAQTAIQSAQKAQQTMQQAQTGSLVPQGFAAPVDKVKTGVNPNVARKNLKAMQQKAKVAFAKVHQEQMHHPLPPKPASPPANPPMQMKAPEHTPPKMAIDPSLIAGLGSQLQQAQSMAQSLKTGAVGPQNAADILRSQTNQRRVIESEDYQHDHMAELQQGPKPGGRGR